MFSVGFGFVGLSLVGALGFFFFLTSSEFFFPERSVLLPVSFYGQFFFLLFSQPVMFFHVCKGKN